jgi:anti-sigma factor RsiW
MTARPEDPDDFTPDLHAYLDGELGPEAAAAVEARLADDPEAAARFDAYAQHKALLAESAHDLALATAAPDTARLEGELARTLARRESAPARSHPFTMAPWPANLAAAAALMAVGWFGNAVVDKSDRTMPAYVSEAVGAHRVFAEDFIRPAEFDAGSTRDVAAWLSTKLGHAVRIPRLDGMGMALVGTRIHGTKEGPIVQAIYENEAGDRLSLTMARHPDAAPAIVFESRNVADTRVGYWSQGPLDYAVVTDEPQEAIRAIASELQIAGKSRPGAG